MKNRSRGHGGSQYVARPAEELPQLLLEHLDVLQSHCAQYDQGSKHFASEVAINLRVLFSDNPKSINRSLLHQLEWESKEFLDTAKTINDGDPNISTAPVAGLAFQTIIPRDGILSADWEPNLFSLTSKTPLCTPFKSWWDAPILHARSGDPFPRKRIIRELANQDRGGHVAPRLEKVYFELTRNADYGYETQVIKGDAVTNPNEPIAPERITAVSKEGAGLRLLRALVRQIAHETLLTLNMDSSTYLSSIPAPNPGISPIMFVQFRHRKPDTSR
ncbi:MAG: hypothetical protein ACYDC8_02725 [Gammaproteobacteria bacterium]